MEIRKTSHQNGLGQPDQTNPKTWMGWIIGLVWFKKKRKKKGF